MVSACLCGIRCRYDGRSKPVERFVRMYRGGHCVPFCPEVLGGLTTPREPAVIHEGSGFDVLDGSARVLLRDAPGDVTEAFLKGADMSLRYARLIDPKIVFLKEKSPSCGIRTGDSMPGVAAAVLIRAGYHVEAVD